MTLPPPPPALDALPYGTTLQAGLGTSRVIADLDFETYSEAGYVWDDDAQKWQGPPGAPGTTKGLPIVGAEPYAAHPTAEIIWLAYDLKDGLGKRMWRPGLPLPADLFVHIQMGGLLEAWNVGFERWIWKHVCVARLRWPEVREDQWRCAAAKARAFGLPPSLAKAGEVLQLGTQKDPEGVRLMKRLSMPRNPTKGDPRRRVLPLYEHPGYPPGARKPACVLIDEDHADTIAYGRYNLTDIVSEAEASAKIPDLQGDELRWWKTHEAINRRGVHIDVQGVDNCIAVFRAASERYNGELLAITGIDAASKVSQLLAWLRGRGVEMEGLDEDQVSSALKRPDLDPAARRVLQIRAAVGSASVKKLFAIRNRLSADNRLRDLYIYHGARTGRCIAEGQLVRVKDASGQVLDRPIEDVRPDDLLWDGEEWVRHDGVVFSGSQPTVTHDGVTGTPEHPVFISPTEVMPLAQAAHEGRPLWRGE